jgi:predicted transcriptional regulator
MTITITENAPKRRDQLVIIAEIINIAKSGSSKTHIMFKANLSFKQLNQYLSILTETGLLEKSQTDGKEIYSATQKGLNFVEKQREIISLLNIDIHEMKVKTSFGFYPLPKSKPFMPGQL